MPGGPAPSGLALCGACSCAEKRPVPAERRQQDDDTGEIQFVVDSMQSDAVKTKQCDVDSMQFDVDRALRTSRVTTDAVPCRFQLVERDKWS